MNTTKEYRVWFSFYSELDGEFDTVAYTVSARDQFKARQIGWEAIKDSDVWPYMSCVRQCGLTWNAAPHDLQDYFVEKISNMKCHINVQKNVTENNLKIRDRRENLGLDLSHAIGYIDALNDVARDIGKPLGILPPAIYEEIEYARQLSFKLYNPKNNEIATELEEIIEKAQQWDVIAEERLLKLFQDGNMTVSNSNKEVQLKEYFGQDGVYPIMYDPNESDKTYVYRWKHVQIVNRMTALSSYDDRSVIQNSDRLPYHGQTLVVKREALEGQRNQKMDLLWKLGGENEEDFDFTDRQSPCVATNLITGEQREFYHEDFHGILRPEINLGIRYDALREEYAKHGRGYAVRIKNDQTLDQRGDFQSNQAIEDEDEWGQEL
jgi:hypothetical protein